MLSDGLQHGVNGNIFQIKEFSEKKLKSIVPVFDQTAASVSMASWQLPLSQDTKSNRNFLQQCEFSRAKKEKQKISKEI